MLRRALLYRSRQTGWLETDIIMGRWAEANVHSLSKVPRLPRSRAARPSPTRAPEAPHPLHPSRYTRTLPPARPLNVAGRAAPAPASLDPVTTPVGEPKVR
jgi:hypothetical protein